MTEKKKSKLTPKTRNIIISIVCVAVLLAGIITSIVLATRKIFKIDYDSYASYNTHTTMKDLDFDKSILIPNNPVGYTNETYTNGTMIVKESGSELHGIYSLLEDKLIVDTEYTQSSNPAELGIAVETTDEHDTLFRLTNGNGFRLVNDEGIDTELTFIEDNKTYAHKMSREIITTSKKDEVRVKIKNDFIKEKIQISNVELLQDYHGEDYEYEVWKLTTTDAVVYQNIYKVQNGKRQLIQTLGLTEGIEFTTPNNFAFFVSSEGEPLIQEVYEITRNAGSSTPITIGYKYKLYDIKYNKIGELEIDNEIMSNVGHIVHVGDYTYFQVVKGATEKKHDFYIAESLPDTLYFNVTTYKIDNSKATMTEVNFDFIIEDVYYKNSDTLENLTSLLSTQTHTATLSIREIEGKQLNPSKLVLVNEKLQTRDIEYVCNEIIKLSDKRFIAIDGEDNYYLIDNNYKLIKRLGKIDSYFTTEDSILLNINSITYVCNLDGVIIKKYNSDNITNIHHERFYLVNEIVNENGAEKTRYYLEQCGYRHENYIYETYAGMNSFKYNEETYAKLMVAGVNNTYSDLNSSNLSIIVRIKEVSSTNYTYEFYNYENDALLTLSNLPNSNMTITPVYSNDDTVIIYCNYNDGSNNAVAGKYFKLDR